MSRKKSGKKGFVPITNFLPPSIPVITVDNRRFFDWGQFDRWEVCKAEHDWLTAGVADGSLDGKNADVIERLNITSRWKWWDRWNSLPTFGKYGGKIGGIDDSQ